MNAPAIIASPDEQTGVLGEDVAVDCAAVSVPEPTTVTWEYHGQRLDESELFKIHELDHIFTFPE